MPLVSQFGTQLQPGPCVGCGATNYSLSLGGPGLCPLCDCLPPERRLKDVAAQNRRNFELVEKLTRENVQLRTRIEGLQDECNRWARRWAAQGLGEPQP